MGHTSCCGLVHQTTRYLASVPMRPGYVECTALSSVRAVGHASCQSLAVLTKHQGAGCATAYLYLPHVWFSSCSTCEKKGERGSIASSSDPSMTSKKHGRPTSSIACQVLTA